MNGDKLRVLVVEDEPLLSEMITKSLKLEGYLVESAGTGEDGLKKVKELNPDLVLLDVLLPKIDGWEVLTRLRDDPKSRDLPIIMLTALADEKSKVQGLRGGADDYVTKPFDMRKLLARIKALLRRSAGGEESPGKRLEWAGIVMDTEKHEVTAGGKAVHLTPTEYRLLELLMQRPGRMLSREYILDSVWEGYYGSSKTLDVHVRHLREKLETDPSRPRLVKTVRGAGYRLDRPADS